MHNFLKKHILLAILVGLTVSAFSQPLDTILPKRRWIEQFYPANLVKRDFRFLPVPSLSNTPETGLKGGVAFSYFFNANEKDTIKKARDSYAYLDVQYSTMRQLFVELYAQTFTSGEKFFIRGRLGYSDNVERIWGFGNTTQPNNMFETVFYERTYLQASVLRKAKQGFFVGGKVNMSNMYNLENPIKDSNILAGLPGAKQSFVAGIGPTVIWDHRNHPLATMRGWYTEVAIVFHSPALGSKFTYTDVVLDARKYFPIGKKAALAVQGFANLTSGTMPWREMPRMGSGSIMRGYFGGRFRDNQYLAAQAEARVPVHKLFTLAGFAAVGQVQSKLGNISLADNKFAFGGGVRILANAKKQIMVRLDYGITTDGNSGFYIKLGEAF